ncbi:P-loop containing nucleoside triphosphate hydrolase protein [Pisolithus microcarpus]|nr:P-loop containing nucleoside triphosphate hydrolase protein [Pisolithus microcarpus]
MKPKFKRRKPLARPGVFDPTDTRHVKHTRMGVWDFYEERPYNAPIPYSSRLETYAQLFEGIPFAWRMMKDICSMRRCLSLICLYILVEVARSLIPAVSLWYSGQLILLVEVAVEKRTVDKDILLRVAGGRIACTLAERILQYCRSRITVPLNRSIKQYYSTHIFQAMARLDLPTFEDPAVQRQLESAWTTSWKSSIAWETIEITTNMFMTSIRLLSQLSVLINILRDQRDGPLLAILSFSQCLFQWFSMRGPSLDPLVWAATTKNQDYIRMQGYKHVVDNPLHRKEVVAGNLSEHLSHLYKDASARVGDDAMDFPEIRRAFLVRDRLTLTSILREPLRELPQIVFTLRAIQYPISIPISLASLTLITQTANSFSSTLFQLFGESFSLSEQFASVRKLYEISMIPNRVVDGTISFPENQQTLKHGVSIEFRNVSFKYPGADKYALRDVSFTICAGQLCVIVGVNGSGKSTILKLISRLYDPSEGTILIDGQDIKTLKLRDLRRTDGHPFSRLYAFPSIGQSSPVTVRDYYSALPEGTTTLFGRQPGRMHTSETSLSGGQMQRLAVARTFMRSLVSEIESPVGLLLFDEPSASLDPTCRTRLRTLRGSKTMVFSSHRFGNLTRHADLILYMDDMEVQEAGTHDELIARNGEYARVWSLQAEAFL